MTGRDIFSTSLFPLICVRREWVKNWKSRFNSYLTNLLWEWDEFDSEGVESMKVNSPVGEREQ